ncbi:MAG: glycosyltransferase family 2 protein [Bacteroidales bacterium]|nr:glycosyltransferase family 2 protein [Bacteroidales bacterium]
MINFSIIIPHYNIPDLLIRCLHSVPVRDDIQVIVVDDCTPQWSSIYATTPEFHTSCYEFYSTDNGASAGRARNIGLQHALGKWVLFVDADDLLSESASSLFDSIADREEDIVFFRTKSVKSDDLSVTDSRNYYDILFDDYFNTGDEGGLRYGFQPVWGKVFKKSFLNGIWFDCTRYSNDVKFSFICGAHAGRIAVSDQILYIVTSRDGSLASSQFSGVAPTLEECLCRYAVALDVYKIAKQLNVSYRSNLIIDCLHKLKAHYKLQYVKALAGLLFIFPSIAFGEVTSYVLRKLAIKK